MGKKSNDTKLCFVLMPFSGDFKNQWELAFIPAIKKAGLIPWRGDEKSLGTNIIMSDVTSSISKAQLIIADLTGKNPNVMYELGLAHAAKKPVIVLAQKEGDIPFDIKHIRFLKYDIKDLSGLIDQLYDRISHTLSMERDKQPDFFPELEILKESDLRELNYLRERAISIEITSFPPIADLFFNDNYIGHAPQVIKVNPDAGINTISAAFPQYFEYHQELTEGDYDSRKISINLEQRRKEEFSKRVPRWLRNRRLYPDNPVLMLAISFYLMGVEEFDEAEYEITTLLKLAPGWYLAHNLYGGYYVSIDELNKAEKYFQRVVSLKPDHYLGYYNLACTYSLQKDYEKCISNLNKILDSDAAQESYSCLPYNTILVDTDFDSIKNDTDYGPEFNRIVDKFSVMYDEKSNSCISTS